ncbi:NAD-dependent epimerase/dehydratase family protein [Candidatus Bathyarchaeota archaeon]|nr:NAD-dependent epimerase/dehydratase family protein [Candidatus Bathyarchaeota archaeon]
MVNVLVTGGLGFIGSHLADMLVARGHDVRVLDNMTYQVHQGHFPRYANPDVEYIIGDVRKRFTVERALEGVEVIFHEAAAVGVGQSMYQVHHYTEVNVAGTAMILDVLVNGEYPIKKMIVAASNTIYGEGLYHCDSCGDVSPPIRSKEQLASKQWNLACPSCAKSVKPIATPETKRLDSTNVYSLNKKYQEEMCLAIGETYGIPVTSLRYFNVYGPRQSLSNPYTGVAAIFMSRIKNGNPPYIYEDGEQTRDFVHVDDVAGVNCFVMDNRATDYQAINVGTSNPVTIKRLAEELIEGLGASIKPVISNIGRPGDIRHCHADISKLENLGYKHHHPTLDFSSLLAWGENIEAEDNFDQAKQEFDEKLIDR